MTRLSLLLGVLLMIAALACGGIPRVEPTPSTTGQVGEPSSTATPASGVEIDLSPATTPPGSPSGDSSTSASPTPTPAEPTPPDASDTTMAQSFFLEVFAPENESITNQPMVEVKGRTVADAVVTINGQVVEVNAEGEFASLTSLEEGPNAIEVVASDFHGNQEGHVVMVIYAA